MPIFTSIPGYPGFNPRGYHETQGMRDVVDAHVPVEVQHFAVSSAINILARNPYVFVGIGLIHAGYHIYEEIFSGAGDSASVVISAVSGGIVTPATRNFQGVDLGRGPGGSSRPRGYRGQRVPRGMDVARCLSTDRRGRRCVKRRGHSKAHFYK